jgi:hypothetical protein
MKRNFFLLVLTMLLSMGLNSRLSAQNWKVSLDFDKHTATIEQDSSYLEYTGALEIPGEIYYNNELYKVVGIGLYAFQNCSGITSLVFPDNITQISDYAFSNCTGLKTVRFGHSLKSAGDGAFQYCSGITSLTLPDSLCMLGIEAFSGCSGLKELSIGSQFAGCENCTFGGCHFDKVVYRGTVEQLCKIGFGTLCYSSADGSDGNPLNNISLLARAQNLYIGDTQVHDLVIPNTVQAINKNLFANCSFLTSVTFGMAVNYIGTSCFERNPNLKYIRFMGETPPRLIGNKVFSGLSSGTRLIVPCGCTAAYDSVMSVYHLQVEESLPYLYAAVTSDSAKGRVEVLSTPDCDNPQLKVKAVAANGNFLFSHWHDNDTNNPRTVDVVSDTVLVAHFIAVDDAVPEYASSDWKCSVQDGFLHVSGADGEQISISDVTGRVLYRGFVHEEETISLPSSGVFFVKVGNRTVRKVVSAH